MEFNPKPHHRRSIRLPDFDYSQPGAYFVTLVAFRRECLFGEIHQVEMQLNEAGQIVWDVWNSLPARYPGVTLGLAVVMPNHFHGILIINEFVGAIHELPLREHELPLREHELPLREHELPLREHELPLREHELPLREHELPLREHELPLREHELPLREHELPLREHELPLRERELPLRDETQSRAQRRRMTLPLVVGYFKMNTAKQINTLLNSSGVPIWQRNYYEHIIRNNDEHDRIQFYIESNIDNWTTDDENPIKTI